MTEREVRIINGKEVALYRHKELDSYLFAEDAVDLLLKALEEVEQYRAIGTVEEFKVLKENDIPIIHGKAELELHDKEIRNKAIEEFAEKFIYKAVCEGCSGCCGCYEESRQSECEDWKAYMEIAEQLKGGAI